MTSLKDRLHADLVGALKSKDTRKREVIRALLTAVRNTEIQQGAELDDAGVLKVLGKQLKQRRESETAFAARPDLAEVEKAEAAIIGEYLPERLSDEELKKLVNEAIAATGASSLQDMGKVMAAVTSKVAGRGDGATVAALVKARLA